MNTPDRIVSFEINLVTADDCTSTTTHKVSKAGKLGKAMGGEFDVEPELQTTGVDVVAIRASGARESIELDGDQHRELECYSSYEALLERILGGQAPQAALEQELELCADAARADEDAQARTSATRRPSI